MAMRMDPATAQQPVFPEVAQGPLVFFLGFALIVVNFYVANASAGVDLLHLVFTKHGPAPVAAVGITDSGLQVVGLGILVLLAQYGGEGAGSFALLFVLALWLLFLVTHVGGLGATPSSTPGNPGGGNIHKAAN